MPTWRVTSYFSHSHVGGPGQQSKQLLGQLPKLFPSEFALQLCLDSQDKRATGQLPGRSIAHILVNMWLTSANSAMKGHLHLNSITVDPRCNVPGCNRFPVTTFRWSRERSHRDTMLVSCLLHSHSLAFRDLHFVCHSWAGNDWRSAFPGCAGRDCGCCHCACKHMRNDKVMGRVGPLHHLSAATPLLSHLCPYAF